MSDAAVLTSEEFIEEKINGMKPEIGNLRSFLNYELSSASVITLIYEATLMT